MNNYIIIGFLLGAILITIYFLILKNKVRRDNLSQLHQPPMVLSDNELLDKVKHLLVSGKKIEAIKLLRTHTKSGLLEAKNYIENLEKNIPLSNVYQKIENVNTGNHENDDNLLAQIRKLLSEGKKIQAIKLVVENKKMGLKEAKDFVESLQ